MEGLEDPFLVALCHLECDHLDFHLICQDHHLINQECHQGCLQDLVHLVPFQDHRLLWDHHRKALEGLLVDPLQEGDQDFLGHTQAVGHL